jgi:hypothetical protein
MGLTDFKIRPSDGQSPPFGLISRFALTDFKIRPSDGQSPPFGLISRFALIKLLITMGLFNKAKSKNDRLQKETVVF